MRMAKSGKKYFLPLLLVMAAVLSVIALPGVNLYVEAAVTDSHVIINQVYGGSTDGYASHSFIELYNPTDEAVDLSGWTIQYKSSEDGDNSSAWEVLELTGTIGPKDYYLIRCAAVTKTGNVKYTVPAGNQEWNMVIHNKGFSVVLVAGKETLSNDLEGDICVSGVSYVDCLAAQGNDAKDSQAPIVYEGSYSAIQSKKKAVRRVNFADTDNNADDCTAVDYSGTVSAAYGPHVGTYVALTAQTVTITDAAGVSVSALSLTKGDTSQVLAVTDGDGTISYSSSDTSVAEIDESGTITATGTGSAVITATASETDTCAAGSASVTVTVSQVDQGYTLKTDGFTNGTDDGIDLTKIGSYVSGTSDPDGGVTEIISYDSVRNEAWSVNGNTGMLEIIDLTPVTCASTDTDTDNLEAEELDIRSLAEAYVPDFAYGDMTSVSVNSDLGIAAVALQAEGYADNGYVALISTETREILAMIETGCQPDMVCFTPDGTKILTANEGEPREGYGEGTTDPCGSVTIITLDAEHPEQSTANTVGFEAYDDKRDELVNDGVILASGIAPSLDLEPEYIAATDTTAYVALQEANAIAVLDLESGTFTGIYSLGYKDLSLEENAIDLVDDGDYRAKTYENAVAAYMPDGISLYEINGQVYLLTANEGDAREWGDYTNEAKVTLTATDGTSAKKVRTIDADVTDGLPEGKSVLFGARSFSIYMVTDEGLTQVYDSANEFEALTAEYVAGYFNCSNDDNDYDSRSQKKGPEPESVTVGTVGDKTYAFIALERVGGIMVYDITDPANASFVNYVNSRDFSEDPTGTSLSSDISPEGLYFISAEKSASGTAILLTAFEVSGTVAAYAVGDEPDGHSYGEPQFVWDETEDAVTCTAVFTCAKCGDEQLVDCTVTAQTAEATCTEDGQMLYTASCTFADVAYSDVKTITLTAAGHTYEDGICTVCGAADPDYSAETADPADDPDETDDGDTGEGDAGQTGTDGSDMDEGDAGQTGTDGGDMDEGDAGQTETVATDTDAEEAGQTETTDDDADDPENGSGETASGTAATKTGDVGMAYWILLLISGLGLCLTGKRHFTAM